MTQQGPHDNGQQTAGPTFDVAARLRILTCQVCGIPFGMPAALHVHRTHQRQPVYCPAGHENRLTYPTDSETSDTFFGMAMPFDELLDAKRRAELAETNRSNGSG